MISISFKMTPEAFAVIESVGRTRRQFEARVDRALERIATTGAERVKGIIEQQKFAPLQISLAWAARKRKEGLDPRTLVATKKYLDSILPKRIGKNSWGITADMLKAILSEYGWRRIKGRPHWGPALRELSKEAGDIFAEEVLRDLPLD